MKIESTEQALTLALHLAITAPDQEHTDELVKMAESFAANLTPKQVDLCMKAAEAMTDYRKEYKDA